MTYTISKTYGFEAAHSLPHTPADHQCHRLHGHSYEVLVAVTGPLVGEWVQDFSEISGVVKPVIASLDHRNLNDILPCSTTAENLAKWLWDKIKPGLPLLTRIEVRETSSSNVVLTDD
jgi:6-pyruvoyltetrahydropterin/6-carboxytetrahydropterin synthase